MVLGEPPDVRVVPSSYLNLLKVGHSFKVNSHSQYVPIGLPSLPLYPKFLQDAFVPAPISQGVMTDRLARCVDISHASLDPSDPVLRMAFDATCLDFSSLGNYQEPPIDYDLLREAVRHELTMDSSPGYPYRSKYPTKLDAVNCDVYWAHFIEFDKSLESGAGVSHVNLSLKQEFLRREKAESNDTRIFAVMNIDHYLSCYRHLRWLNLALNHGSTPCSIGKDWHYGGWHKFLGGFPFDWWAFFDFKGFDLSMSGDVFPLFALMLASIGALTPSISSLIFMARYKIYRSPNGELLFSSDANPSGWFLTLMINTFAVLLFWWYHIFRLLGPISTSLAKQIFVMSICGDDSLLNFPEQYKWVFDFHLILETASIFGYVVKPSNVTNDVTLVEYCGATSVWRDGFLLRRGRFEKFYSCLFYRVSDLVSLGPYFDKLLSYYDETWVDPSFHSYLRELIEVLLNLFPQYRPRVIKRIKSDFELRFLHTGSFEKVAA